jgi:hypothetical protein
VPPPQPGSRIRARPDGAYLRVPSMRAPLSTLSRCSQMLLRCGRAQWRRRQRRPQRGGGSHFCGVRARRRAGPVNEKRRGFRTPVRPGVGRILLTPLAEAERILCLATTKPLRARGCRLVAIVAGRVWESGRRAYRRAHAGTLRPRSLLERTLSARRTVRVPVDGARHVAIPSTRAGSALRA